MPEENAQQGCLAWLFRGGNDKETLKENQHIEKTIARTKQSTKSIHLKALQVGNKIKKLEEEGKQYLEQGDEEHAHACAALLLQMNDQRSMYIQIWTKHKALLQELDKALALSACTESLRESSAVLGKVISENLNVADIDQMMVSLEMQQRDVDEASKALSQHSTHSKKTNDILNAWRSEKVMLEFPKGKEEEASSSSARAPTTTKTSLVPEMY